MSHRRNTTMKGFIFPLIGFLGGLACAFFLAAYFTLRTQIPWRTQYIPVDTIMELAGYTALPSAGEDTLLYEKQSPQVTVSFDMSSEKVMKNQYTFGAEGELFQKGNQLYATESLLERILVQNIRQKKTGSYVLSNKKVPVLNKKSAGMAPFICHFLGGLYLRGEDGKLSLLKNTYSLEALTSCYEKGFRFFETRFAMTADGVLVPFYDLEGAYGTLPTYEEFLSQSPYGLTQMDALTLLTQMQVNPDMLLIVSMHQGCENLEECVSRFSMLLDMADSLGDETLKSRIIPQFYSAKEREALLALYPFTQTIYVPKLNALKEVPEGEEPPADYEEQVTAYNKSVKKIVSLAKKCEDIAFVSFSKDVIDADLCKKIQKVKKKVFVYTQDRIDTLYQFLGIGVDGFYTTVMPPAGYKVQVNMMPLGE